MFTITRDGKHVKTVSDEFELLRWFHRKHSCSIAHAIRYEGYAVLDETGNRVAV
jgi:hypothetical protein